MTPSHASPDPSSAPTPGARKDALPPHGVERRKNPHLRELIEEMLVSVRVATNRELWSDEHRRNAEEEMSRLMERIHLHTFRRSA